MALCGAVLGKRQAWNVSVLQFSEGELYRVCFSPAEVPFPSLGVISVILPGSLYFELYSQNRDFDLIPII